jgi:hypothetical protein
MTKQIKLIVRFLLTLILVSGILLTKQAFARYTPPIANTVFNLITAKEAKEFLLNSIEQKHAQAISWWVPFINSEIEKASYNGYTLVDVDVTGVNPEVVRYLIIALQEKGYSVEFEVRQANLYIYGRPRPSFNLLEISW